MKKKNIKSKDAKSERVKSYYDILNEASPVVKDVPDGFLAVFLFIEGDARDIRLIGLN